MGRYENDKVKLRCQNAGNLVYHDQRHGFSKICRCICHCECIVSSKGETFHARFDGCLSVSKADTQLDKLWNGVAAAWSEGGTQDPYIQMLCFAMTCSKPILGQHSTNNS